MANNLKQAAAEAATSLVTDNMIVGLGTGSTAWFAVEALGRRVAAGLSIIGIPTSEATAQQARSLNIPLATLAEHPEIDLAIDGADEIVPGPLHLTKGRGGALLREKLVEVAAKQLLIIADESKIVDHLGSKMPIPVEVIPFGWQSTAKRLEALGARVAHRAGFTTDSGNYIVDCVFAPILDPETLAQNIKSITGVVEHGMFLGMATQVFLGVPGGVKVLTRTSTKPL
ncbi:MAG: ribose-5-phosphate isomerase RpiA [Acidobacteriota bacterium]